MTPEQTEELEALKAALKQHIGEAEKATPGPWHTKPTSHDYRLLVRGAVGSSAEYRASLQMDGNDAAFIAKTRTMSPLACRIALAGIKALEEIDAADKDNEMGAWKDLADILTIWKGGEA